MRRGQQGHRDDRSVALCRKTYSGEDVPARTELRQDGRFRALKASASPHHLSQDGTPPPLISWPSTFT